MEGPGISMFQGGPSIHLNNSEQDRLDEQEHLEDQKRLHEELKTVLDNGFNDFQEDDEACSLNSSANYTMDNTNPANKHLTAQHNLYNVIPFHESQGQLITQTPTNHCYKLTNYNNERVKLTGAGDCQKDYPFYTELHNGIGNDNDKLRAMLELQEKNNEMLDSELKICKTDVESLRARLSIATKEKEQAEFSLQQTQQLLASNKHKCIGLEQEIKNLEGNFKLHEAEKEQMNIEISTLSRSLQETQQKIESIKVTNSHNDDMYFREQEQRHMEEIDRLHTELTRLKSKLMDKDNEIKSIEKRSTEAITLKDELLSKNSRTINSLAEQLSIAQNKVATVDINKFKEKICQLTAERNAAKEQIKEFGLNLERTTQELVTTRKSLRDMEEWRKCISQTIDKAFHDSPSYGTPSSPGKLIALEDIISRFKQQSQKISSLQEEISKRDKKLESFKKQESELQKKIEEYKMTEMQLNSNLVVMKNKIDLLNDKTDSNLIETYRTENNHLQTQLDKISSDNKSLEMKISEQEIELEKLRSEKGSRISVVQEANSDLLRELEKYSAQVKETNKENSELKSLYVKVCSERDSTSREIKEAQYKLNLLQKEREQLESRNAENLELLEGEKRKVEKIALELASEREELERANKRISELHKEFTDKQKDFTEKLNKYIEEERSSVRKELEVCLQCEKNTKTIKHLEEQLNKSQLKLATQSCNEELMAELKNKALYFENYIMEKFQKLLAQKTVATNTDGVYEPQMNGVLKEDEISNLQEDTIDSRTSLMQKEKEIRDQIAEKFTLEMKTIEMNCTKRLKEMENDHICSINKLKQLLEKKADEVETLKQFILSERSKITMIMEAKENEISTFIKENNVLQTDYQNLRERCDELRNSLEKSQARISKLKIELERKHLELSSDKERLSKGRSEMNQKMQLLEAKNAQLEAQHELLKEKYKNVKRTAQTYKDYALKKDEHVESEMQRIQSHYKTIVTDLQSKIQQLLSKRQQNEITDRISRIQTNFNAVMSDNPSQYS